ncbi:hypothetical protein [Propionispora vibrioides]|uniref:Uncharacterized protein n=1 Tax=Propionispora vibrioides TaxID=112903 RepID=A0A1H8WQX9_9FIRM|nr:hypothetical protein [Propionispora vibrioides]SEP29827.1 hypothetical protein SAMN04490178_11737 [Propionispora vibrioides]
MRRFMPFLVLFCLWLTWTPVAAAQTAAEDLTYEVQSYSRADTGELYKDLPLTWYPAYALREFDAFAPTPGADWPTGPVNKKTPPVLKNWLAAAQKQQWLTTKTLTSAEIGALLVLSDSYGTYLGVITELHPSYVCYKMPNVEGLPSRFRLDFADKDTGGYRLEGLILPRKAGSAAPSFAPSQASAGTEAYKGLPGNSPLIPLLKTFDSHSQTPIAWSADPEEWITLTEAQGLTVSFDPRAAKPNALLLTYKDGKIAALSLVRAVYPDKLIVEKSIAGEQYLEQLPLDRLTDFAAYIYPE